MSIWWCNQARCWEQERKAKVVCASKSASLTYRQTVGHATKGDIVVHYVKPYVVAFSIAKTNGRAYEELPLVSGHDYGSGWRFKTDYFDLQNPINRSEFAADLVPLIVKHYPIDKRSYVRQGYFFPFDRDGLKILLKHTNEPLPEWL